MNISARAVVIGSILFSTLVLIAAFVGVLLSASQCGELRRRSFAQSLIISDLSSRLDGFEKAAASDTPNFYAAFAQALKERPISAQVEIRWSASYHLVQEVDKTTFPADRKMIEDGSIEPTRQVTKSRLLRGLVLGVRSHTVFAMFVLPHNDPALTFSATTKGGTFDNAIVKPPKDVATKLKSDSRLDPNNYVAWPRKYEFRSVCAAVKIVVTDNNVAVATDGSKSYVKDTEPRAATIVQTATCVDQKGFEHSVLIVGYELPSAPASDLKPLPFRSEKNWSTFVEKLDHPFPVALSNGCISLIVPPLDRKYDHNGKLLPWEGNPGSIHALFVPVDVSSTPVLHSLILQIDDSHAQWMPFWSLYKKMGAASGGFNVPLQYEFLGEIKPAECRTPSDQKETDESERKKLCDIFDSLHRSIPIVAPR